MTTIVVVRRQRVNDAKIIDYVGGALERENA